MTTISVISFDRIMESNERATCPNYPNTDEGNIKRILYYASLAGSAYNAQPWDVVVKGNEVIEIYFDESKSNVHRGLNRRYLFLSIGCFLENMAIAAENLSYAIDVHIDDASNGFDDPVAIVKISKKTGKSCEITLQDLENRRTLREEYKLDKIDDEAVEKILDCDREHVHLVHNDSELGAYLSDKMIEMAEQTQSSFDPIPLIKSTAAWVVYSFDKDTNTNLISGGRLNERVNIICRKMNIGFQPMNYITFHKVTVDELAHKMGINDKAVLMSRIGYVDDNGKPITPRRNVDDFTTFK